MSIRWGWWRHHDCRHNSEETAWRISVVWSVCERFCWELESHHERDDGRCCRPSFQTSTQQSPWHALQWRQHTFGDVIDYLIFEMRLPWLSSLWARACENSMAKNRIIFELNLVRSDREHRRSLGAATRVRTVARLSPAHAHHPTRLRTCLKLIKLRNPPWLHPHVSRHEPLQTMTSVKRHKNRFKSNFTKKLF